jgi:hypothetical protein
MQFSSSIQTTNSTTFLACLCTSRYDRSHKDSRNTFPGFFEENIDTEVYDIDKCVLVFGCCSRVHNGVHECTMEGYSYHIRIYVHECKMEGPGGLIRLYSFMRAIHMITLSI